MQRKGFNETVRTKSRATEKAPVIGRVSQVYEKTDDKVETGNIEVNVQTTNVDHQFRRVPVVATDHAGHAFVPEVDDYVVVDFTKGEGTEPIVVGASPTRSNRAPNARAGQWRHEWGSGDERLYLEAQPADNSAGTPELIRLAVKSDGLSEPITELVLNTSGDSHTISADVGDDAQQLLLEGSNGSFTLEDADGFGVNSDGSGLVTVYVGDGETKLQLDSTDGSFSLTDVSGFGITADGAGTVTTSVGSNEAGIQFNNDTGSFKLLDDAGYGIESDGNGNFTWHMNSVNYDDEAGPISLD